MLYYIWFSLVLSNNPASRLYSWSCSMHERIFNVNRDDGFFSQNARQTMRSVRVSAEWYCCWCRSSIVPQPFGQWWFVNWYTASGYRFPFWCIGCVTNIFCSSYISRISSGTGLGYAAYSHHRILSRFSSLSHTTHQRSIYYFYYIFFVLVKWVKHCRIEVDERERDRAYIYHTYLFSTSLKRNIFPRSSCSCCSLESWDCVRVSEPRKRARNVTCFLI